MRRLREGEKDGVRHEMGLIFLFQNMLSLSGYVISKTILG